MTAATEELFKKIRRIEIQTTHLAADILAVSWRSAFRGKGMEFEEVREYQTGDEVRSIDWNVTARMNHPYVKSFREERELTVLLAVDVSASALFGSGKVLKKDLIAEISAVIAFSAIKNNDKVGLILFSDTVEKYIPPRKGVRHVLRVIRELLGYIPSQKGTDIAAALDFIGEVQRRAGICFLISDFIATGYAKPLSIIAKKHDLISIAVTDPFETTFPAMGLIQMTDLETGKSALVDTSDNSVREHLQKSTQERLAHHRQLMHRVGGGHIDIRTDQPYLPPIKKFFKIRERQRR